MPCSVGLPEPVVIGAADTPGPSMEAYYDISNDLKDVWEADIDPVS